ncbi:hypothetical protein IFM89_000514 [Coptis chinensis]|uniref:SANT domain-containing protein n=1 Tax=Coptis chinensis TaxID=261450 RepID=A0A835H0T9_9MAGN|nr:hypothetical protein IFM89_000514 [Coptis chinensis]
MPPEPLPWERKDVVVYRKHDRSDGGLIRSGVARWRDSSSYHHHQHHALPPPLPSREFGHRWASDDFRRPQGHGKQGGQQLYSEDSAGYGCVPFRASDRMVGDENGFRSRNAKYVNRNTREVKGSFSYKETKGYLWESGDANASVRQHDLNIQRSVSDLLTYTPHPQSDVVDNSSWDDLQLRDHQNDKLATVDALGTGHRYGKEQSLGPTGWKPLKWNRSSSLSSRGSGFSHTSSSRSMGADSDETKPDLPSGRATPVHSPSGDANGGAASDAPGEDTCPRKKQRLGWGQGLAKYEKQKVEGSDETFCKSGMVPCSSIPKPSQSIQSLPDKSPRVLGPSECASPVTTSSVACSSSPGIDDKPHIKAANDDIDTCNLSVSPAHGVQSCLEEFSLSLEQLSSATSFNTLLNDLLQLEDASSGDSNFVKSTAMNKLLLMKSELSKALEKTECEIDLFENELKLLNSKVESKARYSVASDSREHMGAVSNVFQKPVPLLLESSSCLNVDLPNSCNNALEEVHGEGKDDEIDSPGTATSKFVETLCMETPLQVYTMGRNDGRSIEDITARPVSSEQHCLLPSAAEKLAVSGNGHEDQQVGSICTDVLSQMSAECELNDVIFVSNRNCAAKSFEVFSKLLPTDNSEIDIWGSCSISCQKNNSLVKQRLAARKCFQRFKERVLTLKFRALHYLWKEDVRLRKYKAKSQKRIESNSRTLHIVNQKHRSNIRSRFTSPVSLLNHILQCTFQFEFVIMSIYCMYPAMTTVSLTDYLYLRYYAVGSFYYSEKHLCIVSELLCGLYGDIDHFSHLTRNVLSTAAGSLTLVPTSEIVDFTSKLLSDSQVKLCRDNLKMPSLLDVKEKRISRFVTSNGLVEDPFAAEKERMMINPWMPEEKEIFLEKLGTFGKDFKKIASYLDHKTTADCVEFYYKNHKSESFEAVKKKSELRKQEKGFPTSTYLMTSGKKWNREVNAASLDLLGEASVIAAHADCSLKSQHTYMSRAVLGGHYYHKTCWGDDASYEKSSSVDILGSEREAAAADTLAGICGALSSEAMSSCVTSSVDPGESCQEVKFQKNSVTDRPLTPKYMQTIDDEETCSDESCGELDSVDWTDEEKSNFIDALRSFGKDFVKISLCVRSRSRDQCKVFFSKARKSLGLDDFHLGGGSEGTPVSDINGGRSDTEDACVLEMESAICSTQSCSKMEIDLQFYVMNTSCEVVEHAATNHLQLNESDRLGEKNGKELLNNLQIDKPEKSGENNDVVLNRDDGVLDAEGLILNKCEPADKSELVLCGRDSSVKVSESLDGSPEIMRPDSFLGKDSSLSCEVHQHAAFTHSTDAVKQHRTTTPTNESLCAEMPGGVTRTMSVDAIEHKAISRSSADGLNVESGLEQGSVDGSQNVKTGLETNTSSSSGCFSQDTNIYRHPSNLASERSISQSFSPIQNQHQNPLELLHSVQKAHGASWKQKEDSPASANSVLPGSVIHFEDHLRQGSSSSTLNFDGSRNEQHQKLVSAEVYQRYLSNNSLNRIDSLQILRGYPLQVLNKKDVNGHVDSGSEENHSVIHNSLTSGNHQSGKFIGQDKKCKGSELPHSLAELSLLSKNHEKLPSGHTRSRSQGSADTDEHSCRNGNVKLFGQILSHHPSTSQKTNVILQETDNTAAVPQSSSNVFELKVPDHGTDRPLTASMFDGNRHSCDDFPARSYGFWDGSRTQTGLTSLPDSSILLTKYPPAFSEYSTASSCGDQQSLPAIITRNDRNLGSISVCPVKDVRGNGNLPDYQGSRSYDGAKVQPFTVDVKRHDTFSELQKRKGIEMSSFQKQARVVGMNVMGTGILVGGSCTGVSDPVAAIKMHYATTERYGGHNGSIREEDSWREDMGRGYSYMRFSKLMSDFLKVLVLLEMSSEVDDGAVLRDEDLESVKWKRARNPSLPKFQMRSLPKILKPNILIFLEEKSAK